MGTAFSGVGTTGAGVGATASGEGTAASGAGPTTTAGGPTGFFTDVGVFDDVTFLGFSAVGVREATGAAGDTCDGAGLCGGETLLGKGHELAI